MSRQHPRRKWSRNQLSRQKLRMNFSIHSFDWSFPHFASFVKDVSRYLRRILDSYKAFSASYKALLVWQISCHLSCQTTDKNIFKGIFKALIYARRFHKIVTKSNRNIEVFLELMIIVSFLQLYPYLSSCNVFELLVQTHSYLKTIYSCKSYTFLSFNFFHCRRRRCGIISRKKFSKTFEISNFCNMLTFHCQHHCIAFKPVNNKTNK